MGNLFTFCCCYMCVCMRINCGFEFRYYDELHTYKARFLDDVLSSYIQENIFFTKIVIWGLFPFK